jgi:hypothetical protein
MKPKIKVQTILAKYFTNKLKIARKLKKRITVEDSGE